MSEQATEFEAISSSGMATFNIKKSGAIECVRYSSSPHDDDAHANFQLTKAEMRELRDCLNAWVPATTPSKESPATATASNLESPART